MPSEGRGSRRVCGKVAPGARFLLTLRGISPEYSWPLSAECHRKDGGTTPEMRREHTLSTLKSRGSPAKNPGHTNDSVNPLALLSALGHFSPRSLAAVVLLPSPSQREVGKVFPELRPQWGGPAPPVLLHLSGSRLPVTHTLPSRRRWPRLSPFPRAALQRGPEAQDADSESSFEAGKGESLISAVSKYDAGSGRHFLFGERSKRLLPVGLQPSVRPLTRCWEMGLGVRTEARGTSAWPRLRAPVPFLWAEGQRDSQHCHL